MNGITMDTSQFEAFLTKKVSAVEQAAENAMYDNMTDLLKKSTNLAPLDKGTLRNTSWIEVGREGSVVEGSVYYSVSEADEKRGGGHYNYALLMHEMGERYKNPTTPGTQPKFLSEPLKANAAAYTEHVADAVRKALG